jgi:hypothetical protein
MSYSASLPLDPSQNVIKFIMSKLERLDKTLLIIGIRHRITYCQNCLIKQGNIFLLLDGSESLIYTALFYSINLYLIIHLKLVLLIRNIQLKKSRWKLILLYKTGLNLYHKFIIHCKNSFSTNSIIYHYKEGLHTVWNKVCLDKGIKTKNSNLAL